MYIYIYTYTYICTYTYTYILACVYTAFQGFQCTPPLTLFMFDDDANRNRNASARTIFDMIAPIRKKASALLAADPTVQCLETLTWSWGRLGFGVPVDLSVIRSLKILREYLRVPSWPFLLESRMQLNGHNKANYSALIMSRQHGTPRSIVNIDAIFRAYIYMYHIYIYSVSNVRWCRLIDLIDRSRLIDLIDRSRLIRGEVESRLICWIVENAFWFLESACWKSDFVFWIYVRWFAECVKYILRISIMHPKIFRRIYVSDFAECVEDIHELVYILIIPSYRLHAKLIDNFSHESDVKSLKTYMFWEEVSLQFTWDTFVN